MVSDEALWTFTFLNLSDIATTLIALRRGAYEMNPIARFFIEKFGLKSLFAFKYLLMSLSLFIAFLLNESLAEQMVWMWNIVLSIVIAWNSYVNLELVRQSKTKKHI